MTSIRRSAMHMDVPISRCKRCPSTARRPFGLRHAEHRLAEVQYGRAHTSHLGPVLRPAGRPVIRHPTTRRWRGSRLVSEERSLPAETERIASVASTAHGRLPSLVRERSRRRDRSGPHLLTVFSNRPEFSPRKTYQSKACVPLACHRVAVGSALRERRDLVYVLSSRRDAAQATSAAAATGCSFACARSGGGCPERRGKCLHAR